MALVMTTTTMKMKQEAPASPKAGALSEARKAEWLKLKLKTERLSVRILVLYGCVEKLALAPRIFCYSFVFLRRFCNQILIFFLFK